MFPSMLQSSGGTGNKPRRFGNEIFRQNQQRRTEDGGCGNKALKAGEKGRSIQERVVAASAGVAKARLKTASRSIQARKARSALAGP